MTELLLMVPPALCSVSPKTAKKMIGAITLLKAKKYWTLVVLVTLMLHGVIAGPYLGVRDAEEGKLKQEVENKATHSTRGDALVEGNVIGNVSKAWPDGCEQNGHALTASGSLDTAYY
jgi:hypothetical protein